MNKVTYRKRPRQTAIKRDHQSTSNSSTSLKVFAISHSEELTGIGIALALVGGCAACGLSYQAFVM